MDIDIMDPIATSSLLRERDFDNILSLQANLKKTKVEDSARDLLGIHVQDDSFTVKFLDECPEFLYHPTDYNGDGSPSMSDDIDLDLALFDDEFFATPPETLALVAHHNFLGVDSRIPRPTRSMEVENMPLVRCTEAGSRVLTPSPPWLSQSLFGPRLPPPPTLSPPASLPSRQHQRARPSIATRRVRVEERTLSTEQRAKHAQWKNRRKKCLTGHAGYKCPAKSRAARNKTRANGRFGQEGR